MCRRKRSLPSPSWPALNQLSPVSGTAASGGGTKTNIMARNEDQHCRTTSSHGILVFEGEGDKVSWPKVGCAWQHGDRQGFNITLSTLPISGRLTIRVRSYKEAR